MIDLILMLAVGLFLYSFLLERFWIVVRRKKCDIGGLKVVILSDFHLGIFKGRRFAEKVVKMVNAEKPELVIMPGDFVYGMRKKWMARMFAEFKKIKAPIYGVLGNHDIKPLGEFEKKEIVAALEKAGVKLLDNQTVLVKMAGRMVQLAGVGSLLCGDDHYEHLENLARADVTLLLAHNPDVAYKLPPGLGAKLNLMICGHTHGGQIRVPWLYKKVIPCEHNFDRGWSKVGGVRVFVSSGLGEVNLPLRFGVRPEVVVVENS